MERTVFEPNPRDKGLAQGYTAFFLGKPEPAQPEAQGWLHAAGGLYATAADLARWDLALIEGKVLKPKSFERMTRPVKLADGTPKTYACGLGVTQRSGETVLQHSGAVSGFLAINTVVPRTQSAVVLLTNSDSVDLGALQNKLVALLLKDLSSPAGAIPKVNGPPPGEIALSLLRGLLDGAVDRSKLSEEFSSYLKEERMREVAARLRALGEVTKIEVEDTSERGGLEVTALRIFFKAATVKGSMYRSPDGKIQQLLVYQQ
jgi:CubicO group peptidase (beta-lactamase class C family)